MGSLSSKPSKTVTVLGDKRKQVALGVPLDVLSSDVHAKWMSSRAPASAGESAIRSRMKYSTALTS